MRFLTPRRWLTGVLCLCAFAAPAQVPPATKTAPSGRDVVMIVALTPETLVDGVETEVEITLAYTLDAKAEGVIDLAANTLRADS